METLEKRLQKRIYVSLYALLFLTTLLGLSILLEGCSDRCQTINEYVYYEPVYTTVEEIRAGVSLLPPQPVNAVGKIYFKDNYLFVSEPGEGIHIINNQDPAAPTPLKFLKIPGTFDLAIKGNTLYADSYVDLIAFDISDIYNISEVHRLEGIFKNYSVMGFYNDASCCVITNFEETKRVAIDESECEQSFETWGGRRDGNAIAFSLESAATFSAKAAIAPGTGSGPGVGGSLARFAINGNHLYLIDGGDLQVVDVTAETQPQEKNRAFLSWDIETIFPYKSNLFIGSSTGMYIMNVAAPESPALVSTFMHVTSCDPVVVNDEYAYVTLRSGTTCRGLSNQLEVIDIKNLQSPQLVKTYPMTNPHGLGIDDNTLFICDGDDGLKAFDATDVNKIDQNLIAHYKEINAVDVIPFNNILMMIGEDGIFQFDYSNPKDIRMLSKIEVTHEE
ncbi:MAG TPA: hypothetical protein VFO54_09015 [Chryseosolibacter sp.]|nr:hypothetical protein [Chryseosolibacter sp.]